MTYAELEQKIIKCLETPDSALVNIKPILEEIKADYVTMVALTEEKEKNETRIRDLQDTNMKLFLAQVGPEKKEEDDEPEKKLSFGERLEQLEKEEKTNG